MSRSSHLVVKKHKFVIFFFSLLKDVFVTLARSGNRSIDGVRRKGRNYIFFRVLVFFSLQFGLHPCHLRRCVRGSSFFFFVSGMMSRSRQAVLVRSLEVSVVIFHVDQQSLGRRTLQPDAANRFSPFARVSTLQSRR